MAAAGKHVALVTGAAGNLGGQIAKKLARSGRYRAVVGTDVSKFTSVQSNNDPQHQQHYVGGVDLTDRTAVEALFQRVGEEKGAGADGDGQLVVVHVAAWPGPAQEPPLSRTLSGWLDISPVSDSNPSPGELFYMFYEQINRTRSET